MLGILNLLGKIAFELYISNRFRSQSKSWRSISRDMAKSKSVAYRCIGGL